jgi:hypothetical protein
MAGVGPGLMTDREAIRRLSLNTSDCLALSWLHHNHIVEIHTLVTRVFGTGPAAEKAEVELMQRIANHARSYERQESSQKWLLRCANLECERLRNETSDELLRSRISHAQEVCR